jgi:HAD superfamily hydrolase (TIGR01490 family)
LKKIAALFDCDGSLYSAQYGRGLIKYASEHGNKGFVRMFYGANLIPYLLRKIKAIAEETYHRLLISRLAWMVQGMTEQELRQASEWINKEYLLPTEYSETVARLREHQSQGHVILLVSAQLYPSLETLGASYNVDGLVGTRIEMKDGRYTGRIIPPVIIGDDKDHYAREYFLTRNIEIDWEASYAYADAITDTGLFSMVGHPVAVNPDPKLLTLAQKGNWEMIGISR